MLLLLPLVLLLFLFHAPAAWAADAPAFHWAAVWAASAQGPYPSGNARAQPNLDFALPNPSNGTFDQTFRLMVRPSLWGRETRLRFSNVFGTRPLLLDRAYAGLQSAGPALVKGTNSPVLFGGKSWVIIAPGDSVWSDPVTLPFVRPEEETLLSGRNLAVSFYTSGKSGPMTWHALAQNTSYLTAPGTEAVSVSEAEKGFAFSTTSCFFLDAVDMRLPAGTKVVAALGDSITDGANTTLNGADRWVDVLARRLQAAHGPVYSVVNAGISGNLVLGPAAHSAASPYAGGPSAVSRLERDVLGLSGLTHCIWLEGINDFGKKGNFSAQEVWAGMEKGVARLRAARPGIRVLGATLPPAIGSTNPNHGSAEQDARRRALNDLIRGSRLFDGVLDFAAATEDPASGGLKPEFAPNSTSGGPGDYLHPNHAGHLAMGQAVDLGLFLPGTGEK